eukprot:TRINITY_DN8399_c0_g1_i3.p1 TRINITY_DN8399_c0_g1~~TRINITY_DN8399_c0_g1_i3.p1  ORF type:complete len:2571 (+),score=1056.42 TRINITY_DN8399_c0_g1_i3:150-7862(+)
MIFRHSLLLVTVFFAALGQVAATPFCIALSELVASPPALDSVSGPDVEVFSWVNAACNGSASSVTFNSGFVAGSISFGSFPSAAVTSVQVSRSITASVTGSALTFNIALNFRATISGPVGCAAPAAASSIVGAMSLQGTVTSLAAVSDYPVQWIASLGVQPASGSQVSIFDPNLLDGSAPYALCAGASSASTSSSQVTASLAVLGLAGDVNMVLGSMDVVPTAVPHSVRGAFLAIPAQPSIVAYSGTSSAFSGSGTAVYASSACWDAASCPASVASAVLDVVAAATGNLCPRAQLTLSSITARVTADVWFSNADVAVKVRSVRAETRASYACGASGSVGVRLSAGFAQTPSTPGMPYALFLTSDPTARIAMAKSVSGRSVTGRLYGHLLDANSTLYSSLRSDLFGSQRGGVFVPDAALDSGRVTSVSSLFANVTRLLSTSVPTVDNRVQALLPTGAALTAYADRYTAECSRPTVYGLLQWVTAQLSLVSGQSIDLYVGPDGSVATLSLSVGSRSSSFNQASDLPTTALLNAALSSLSATVCSTSGVSCGSLATPAINVSTTIASATVSVAYAASVRLRGLGPSLTNVASSVATAPTSRAVVYVQPTFTNTTVLSGAYITADLPSSWSIVGTVHASLQARVTPLVAVKQMVNATLIQDTAVVSTTNFVKGLAAVQALGQPLSPLTSVMTPVTTNPAMLNDGSSLIDALDAVKTAVAATNGKSLTMALAVQATLSGLSGALAGTVDAAVAAVLVPDTVANSIALSITVYRVNRLAVGVQPTQWPTVTTTAVSMPVVVRTTLSTTLLSAGTISGTTVSVSGQGKMDDWTVPVRYQMLAGSATSASFFVTFNLPASGSLSMSLQVLPTRGSLPLQMQIDADLLDVQSVPSMAVTTANTYTMTPQLVYNGFASVLFPLPATAFNVPINISLPPADVLLSTLPLWTVASSFAGSVLAAGQTTDQSVALMSAGRVCASSVAGKSISFNVSVNEFTPVSCRAASINGASPASVAASLNTALAACQMNTFLKFASVRATSADCATLNVLPAVPGVVWLLTIATDSTVIVFRSRFNAQSLAGFADWQDAAQLVSSSTGRPYSAPVTTTVPASLLVQPAYLSATPSTLPAVFINFALSNVNDTANRYGGNQTLPASAVSSLATATGVQLSMSNTSLLVSQRATVSGAIGGAFGVPPQGNVSVFTNCDASNGVFLNGTVSATNRTFDFVATVQIWRPGNVTTINVNSSVTLAVGSTLLAALQAAIPLQLPSFVRPMVSVTVSAGVPLINTVDQARIALTPMFDGTAWWLPTMLGVQNSNVVGLEASHNSPVLTRPVVCNVTLDARFDAQAYSANTTGSIGFFGITTSTLVGTASVRVVARETDAVDPVAAVAGATMSQPLFFSTFGVQMDVNSTLYVPNIELEPMGYVDPTLAPAVPSVEVMSLGKLMSYQLSSAANLTAAAVDMVVWDVSFIDRDPQVASMYTVAQSLDSNTLCLWIENVASVANNFVDDTLSQVSLPITQTSFAQMFESGVLGALNAAASGICGGEQFVLSRVCPMLGRLWDRDVCRSAVVTPTSFTLTIALTDFGKSISDSLHIDLPGLLNLPDLPISVGSAGSVTLSAKYEFEVKLVADWSSGSLQLSIAKGAWFGVGAKVAAAGEATVSLGPLNGQLLGSVVDIPAEIFLNLTQDLSIEIPTPGLRKRSAPSVSVIPRQLRPAKAMRHASTSLTHLRKRSVTSYVSLNLVGSATFSTRLFVMGQRVCDFGVTVPDLVAYFRKQPHSYTIQQCPQGLGPALLNVLAQYTLDKYFGDPLAFVQQWEAGLAGFLSHLVNNEIVDGVPLIGHMVQDELNKVIGGLFGPDANRLLVAGLQNMSTSLVTGKKVDPNVLYQVILDSVTNVLCDIIPVTECPPAPRASADVYDWPMVFNKTSYPAAIGLDFDLGLHGAAAFESRCELALEFNYGFQFILRYTKTKGVQLVFNESQPTLFVTLTMPLDNCQLSGQLGFLGAELSGQPGSALTGSLTVALDERNKWQVDFGVSASMDAKVELGFAGPLVEDLVHTSNALTALPHWQFDLVASWEWHLHQTNTTPAHFGVENPTFCIGTVLSKLVAELVDEALHLLGPLDNLIGPTNGALTRPVGPTKIIFGRTLTVLELGLLVDELFCAGSCVNENVFELIDTFAAIVNLKDQLAPLANVDCGITSALQSFVADFSGKNAKANGHGTLPDINDIKIPSGAGAPSSSQKQAASGAWKKCTTTKFGIRWLLTTDPQQLIDIITGKDLQIVQLIMPSMTLSLEAAWHIPIFPPIFLEITFTAQLRLQPPPIAFGTAGIREMISSHSASSLWRSLSIVTRDDAGNQLWLVSATARLEAAVEINFGVIDGKVYVYIEFYARFGFVNPNGDPTLSFDQLYWLVAKNGPLGVLKIEFGLKAGAGFYVELCLPLGFTNLCITIIDVSIEFPVFSKTIGPKSVPAIASSSGQINMGVTPGGGSRKRSSLPVLILLVDNPQSGGRTAAVFPPGSDLSVSPMTRFVPSAGPVSFAGTTGGQPVEVNVWSVQQLIVLPGNPDVSLRYKQSAYPSATTFS